MSGSCQDQLHKYMDDVSESEKETCSALFNAEHLAASAPAFVPRVLVQQTIGAIDAALSKISEFTECHNCDSNGLTREENEAVCEAKELEKPTAEERNKKRLKQLTAEQIEGMIRDELEPTQKDDSDSDSVVSVPPAPRAEELALVPVVAVPPLDLPPVVAVPEPKAICRPDKSPKREKRDRTTRSKTTKENKEKVIKANAAKVSQRNKTRQTTARVSKAKAKASKAKARASKVKAKARARTKAPAKRASSAAMDDDTQLRKKLHSVTWLLTDCANGV